MAERSNGRDARQSDGRDARQPNVRDTRQPDAVDPLLHALEDPRPSEREAPAGGPSFGARIVIAVVVLTALGLLIYKQSY